MQHSQICTVVLKTWGYHKSSLKNSLLFSMGCLDLVSALFLHFKYPLILQPEATCASFLAADSAVSELQPRVRRTTSAWAPSGGDVGTCRDARWKGPSSGLGGDLPTHLSRTTLMVLRPRAAAIWMTACPTPLLDAFWMTESPVGPGRDPSQALETCNRSRASSLGFCYRARDGVLRLKMDLGP